jgi:hypothetical protein
VEPETLVELETQAEPEIRVEGISPIQAATLPIPAAVIRAGVAAVTTAESSMEMIPRVMILVSFEALMEIICTDLGYAVF